MVLVDAGGSHHTQIEIAADLLDHRVDGLVVLPVDTHSGDWRDVVGRVPTVAVGASLPHPASTVRFGAAAGIRLMLEHLRGLGHEQVLVLTPGVHTLPAVGVGHVPGVRLLGGRRRSGGDRSALSERRRPTAVFALTDTIACGVYAACRELGLRVPADVSVAGFDDHPLSALLNPALTTVGWDTPRAAVTAARDPQSCV